MSTLKQSADFATQAGHWYDRFGNPRYTIIGKNGKERNTTLRDAREHALVPSVTTILRQAAAPGLERWKIGNAIKSALVLARQEGESDDAYLARIMSDSEEISRKARDRGTAIHGAIEGHYIGRVPDIDLWKQVASAVDCLADNCGAQSWKPEKSFAHQLGFGGKVDLHSEEWVIDFKTTDKPLDGLKTWDDHAMQLAAYQVGLDVPKAKCAICYVSSVSVGARLIELNDGEIAKGWAMFLALLDFWRAKNGYDPSLQPLAA